MVSTSEEVIFVQGRTNHLNVILYGYYVIFLIDESMLCQTHSLIASYSQSFMPTNISQLLPIKPANEVDPEGTANSVVDWFLIF